MRLWWVVFLFPQWSFPFLLQWNFKVVKKRSWGISKGTWRWCHICVSWISTNFSYCWKGTWRRWHQFGCPWHSWRCYCVYGKIEPQKTCLMIVRLFWYFVFFFLLIKYEKIGAGFICCWLMLDYDDLVFMFDVCFLCVVVDIVFFWFGVF